MAALRSAGRWLTWWDGDERGWRSLELATGRVASMTAAIPYPVYDESHDRPGPPEESDVHPAGGTWEDEQVLDVPPAEGPPPHPRPTGEAAQSGPFSGECFFLSQILPVFNS